MYLDWLICKHAHWQHTVSRPYNFNANPPGDYVVCVYVCAREYGDSFDSMKSQHKHIAGYKLYAYKLRL